MTPVAETYELITMGDLDAAREMAQRSEHAGRLLAVLDCVREREWDEAFAYARALPEHDEWWTLIRREQEAHAERMVGL